MVKSINQFVVEFNNGSVKFQDLKTAELFETTLNQNKFLYDVLQGDYDSPDGQIEVLSDHSLFSSDLRLYLNIDGYNNKVYFTVYIYDNDLYIDSNEFQSILNDNLFYVLDMRYGHKTYSTSNLADKSLIDQLEVLKKHVGYLVSFYLKYK